MFLSDSVAESGATGLSRDASGLAALLCDRDGTIMENRRDYVREPEHIRLFPDAVQALRQVSESGTPIILVTNQSVAGRGILTVGQVVNLHRRVVDLLSAAGVQVEGTYICPHAPTDACSCRKPAPGMIQEALARFRLDPVRTALVGDAVDDMLAARRAGVLGVMVRTGRGADQAARLAATPEVAHTPVVSRFPAAIELLRRMFQETLEPLPPKRNPSRLCRVGSKQQTSGPAA